MTSHLTEGRGRTCGVWYKVHAAMEKLRYWVKRQKLGRSHINKSAAKWVKRGKTCDTTMTMLTMGWWS